MFGEEKNLIITKLGVDGYPLLAKLDSKHDKIVWLSSSSYIPSEILKAYSYNGNAELFSFYSQFDWGINLLNLNEVSMAISRSGGGERSCVIISCISELIMYYGVSKVYHFILNVIRNTGKFISMMIDGAQNKKDELLISTLFDAVFRLKKRLAGDDWEILLIPEVCIQNKMYRLRYDKGVVELEQILIKSLMPA